MLEQGLDFIFYLKVAFMATEIAQSIQPLAGAPKSLYNTCKTLLLLGTYYNVGWLDLIFINEMVQGPCAHLQLHERPRL
jgi:hypothetical protein